MLTLSFWEEFIVSSAISLLTFLETKMTNKLEIEALQAALTFLQQLVGEGVSVSDSAASKSHT